MVQGANSLRLLWWRLGWSAGAAALSPGGCRCAEGGTPDPCPRDHPARPGVKVEPRSRRSAA
jgi:hypothetical protein